MGGQSRQDEEREGKPDQTGAVRAEIKVGKCDIELRPSRQSCRWTLVQAPHTYRPLESITPALKYTSLPRRALPGAWRQEKTELLMLRVDPS